MQDRGYGLPRIHSSRLSEKSLEGSRAFVLMVLKAAKWCFWPSLDHSWEPRVDLIRNFQTVSEGEFSEVRPTKGMRYPLRTAIVALV
jgi:hypothetical protein